ncbi:MAG TPA: RNA methyltransferase, partial [Ilumatobacter sp.]|nr:RNA methyltransferase [Ilumatobacter sp.]
MELIDDPGDRRLHDYRQLRSATARRRIEGDEFFIAEGPVAIERLIASHHTVRSVLVSQQKY